MPSHLLCLPVTRHHHFLLHIFRHPSLLPASPFAHHGPSSMCCIPQCKVSSTHTPHSSLMGVHRSCPRAGSAWPVRSAAISVALSFISAAPIVRVCRVDAESPHCAASTPLFLSIFTPLLYPCRLCSPAGAAWPHVQPCCWNGLAPHQRDAPIGRASGVGRMLHLPVFLLPPQTFDVTNSNVLFVLQSLVVTMS